MRTLAKVTAMSLLATLARAFTTAAPRRARLRALRAEDTIYALSSGCLLYTSPSPRDS